MEKENHINNLQIFGTGGDKLSINGADYFKKMFYEEGTELKFAAHKWGMDPYDYDTDKKYKRRKLK